MGRDGDISRFQPDQDGPFDAVRAAHLLRRSGFGAAPAEVARVVDDGLDRTVDRLLASDYDPATEELDGIVAAVSAGDVGGLAAWWVSRMVRTGRPLREKMALFWHGHFATSNAKVNDTRAMYEQLRIFLDLGLGPFAPLLVRVAADPAMLAWLDAEKNERTRPNENFARELFELFTLGIGHYTERDVKEAARAFTGWRRAAGRFRWIETRHDDDEKEVLGRRGLLRPEDVLEICVEQPATARHLTAKLLRFFVEPSPPDEAVDAFAGRFAAAGLDVAALLGDLFRSRYFLSDRVIGARILSPVEFVAGAVRTLGARANAKRAAGECARLGQSLFLPPTVKGWDGEEAWIHAGSMIARANCAAALTRADEITIGFDAGSFLGDGPSTPDALAERAVEFLLRRPIGADVVAAVATRIAAVDEDERSRTAIRAVLSLPEASLG